MLLFCREQERPSEGDYNRGGFGAGMSARDHERPWERGSARGRDGFQGRSDFKEEPDRGHQDRKRRMPDAPSGLVILR